MWFFFSVLTFFASAALEAETIAESGIAGLVPAVRLYCLDCGDRYAHQLNPRTFGWGVRGDAIAAVGETWDRRRSGALRIPPLPAGTGPSDLVVLIDGEWFDVTTVYIRYRDEWTNVATLFSLPDKGARETIPVWVRVEQAPFRETPDADDAFLASR